MALIIKDKTKAHSGVEHDDMTLSQWIILAIKVIMGGLFLFFGVQILIGAYRLKDPFSFILTFFAASFIILISATLLIAFVYQAVWGRKHADSNGQQGAISQNDNI